MSVGCGAGPGLLSERIAGAEGDDGEDSASPKAVALSWLVVSEVVFVGSCVGASAVRKCDSFAPCMTTVSRKTCVSSYDNQKIFAKDSTIIIVLEIGREKLKRKECSCPK